MKRVFVPKEFIMVPGTFVGARFNDLGMVFSNVVKVEDYVLHTSTPYSDIVIPLANWHVAFYQHNLIISPN
jgi:hypothetical protein